MAKKEANPEAAPEKPKHKKKRLILVMITPLLLAGLGAGGWYGYNRWFKSDYPNTPMAHVDLNDAVLRFTWQKMPMVYDRLGSLNTQIEMIENEIKRIRRVEKAYPRQQKIVKTETKRWERTLKKLQGQLKKYLTQTEAIFVTQRVNGEKGEVAINEKGPILAEAMDQTLIAIEEITSALERPAPESPGLINRLKSKIANLM